MANHRLGAFELRAPIASGGMGTVWLAKHTHAQSLVAVKVLSDTDPLYVEGFRREVQAVAGLQHPRIVDVYDYGVIADEEANDDLPRGSAWLAMELATRGSLVNAVGLSNFDVVRSVLFDVLDALAHSHARQIIHRDIKPGNVLLVEERGLVRCKLSDFGIAHAKGESLSTREVFASSAGTPWYMPPEQIESRWRDYGPWTDLYAVGCLAYELVTGSTPFTSNSAVDVARKQLFEAPPPLRPLFEVPSGFESWVQRLLKKSPIDRFQRAADAAWALRQMKPTVTPNIQLETPTMEISEELDISDFDTLPDQASAHVTPGLMDTTLMTLPVMQAKPTEFQSAPGEMTAELPALQFLPAFFTVPPITEEWRRGEELRSRGLTGAGLGLFGLRETPFVGREVERDAIWAELREAARHRSSRTVLVQGASGTGKTRLAEWMAQRADEMGSATVIWAQHGPTQTAGAGFRGAVERFLGCVGLSISRTFERVQRTISTRATDAREIQELTNATVRLLRPNAEGNSSTPDFLSQSEMFATVLRLLELQTAFRPCIVVVDDAQWGHESLQFIRYVQNRHSADEGIPVLFLVTARDDIYDLSELERGALADLASSESCTLIDLKPLGEKDHVRYLDGILGLAPDTREFLLKRTKGSPLFSLHVLEDWVDRGYLSPGPAGYQLNREVTMPRDLFELWLTRLRRGFESEREYEHGLRALELAAAMGHDVEAREWRAIAERLGIKIPDGMLDDLASRGLVRWTQAGWAFAHGSIRDGLIISARQHKRAKDHHRAIALFLASNKPSLGNASRRARHLLEAGETELAITPLLQAIDAYTESGRAKEAAALVEQARIAITETGLPANDERYCNLLLQRMVLDSDLHGGESIPRLAKKLLENTEDGRWPSLRSGALRMLSKYWFRQGDYEQAVDLAKRGAEIARDAHDPAAEAEALKTGGWSYIFMDDLESASDAFHRALEKYQSSGHRRGSADVLGALSEVSRLLGNYNEARRFASLAHQAHLQAGDRFGVADALAFLGNIAFSENDFDAADRYMSASVEILTVLGLSMAESVRLQLVYALLLGGRARQADAQLSRSEAYYGSSNDIHGREMTQVARACHSAFMANTEGWDEKMRELDWDIMERMFDPDLSRVVERAGDEWKKRGDSDRAKVAFNLAHVLASDDDSRTGVLKAKLGEVQ